MRGPRAHRIHQAKQWPSRHSRVCLLLARLGDYALVCFSGQYIARRSKVRSVVLGGKVEKHSIQILRDLEGPAVCAGDGVFRSRISPYMTLQRGDVEIVRGCMGDFE